MATDLTQLEEFRLVVGFAKTIASQRGDDELTPGHVVAGTWAAYTQGKLVPFATLSAHVKAHSEDVTRILTAMNMTGVPRGLQPADSTTKINVAAKLKEAIASAQAEGSNLGNAAVTFVDHLLAEGRNMFERKLVAYHEAGHAVVSMVLRPEIRVPKVSIKAEGNAAGVTAYAAQFAMNGYEDFLEDLCVAMAGQVAQTRLCGPTGADTGAVSDFAKATEKAWEFITVYGMDEEFGPVSLYALRKACNVSEGWLFDEAQRRLQSMLKAAMTRTNQLVDTHWAQVEIVAKLLLDKETIDEDDIRQVVSL